MFSALWQKWFQRGLQCFWPHPAAPGRCRPGLMALEDRTAPAILIVNTLADTGDQIHLDLREALQTVNSGSSADLSAAQQQQIHGRLGHHDRIQFVEGVRGTLTLEQGELDITSPVVIRGPGESNLTIDGQHQSRVFAVAENIAVSIRGLTLTNGQVSGSDGGGAVLNQGTLTLRQVTLSGNSTQSVGQGGNGGGIANTAGGILTLIDSTVADDRSVLGAGLYNDGMATVQHSTFTDNIASQNPIGGGGGIYNTAGGTVTISDGTFSGNVGRNGGGIANLGTATVDHSNFLGNFTGIGLLGAGIYNQGTLTLTASTLDSNVARVGGGGIANTEGATLTVIASTISNNSAAAGASSRGNGGGISNAGTLTLINSTLYGNTAADGGGLYNLGAVTLTSVTVTANRSLNAAGGPTMGGGLDVTGMGTVLLHNSIVAANFHGTGPDAPADDVAGTVDSTSSFNLIGIGGSGGLSDAVNSNLVGVADARLGPLTDNGGPTKTVALLPDSLAIGNGDPALLHTQDQRGVRRRHHVSIGAFQEN